MIEGVADVGSVEILYWLVRTYQKAWRFLGRYGGGDAAMVTSWDVYRRTLGWWIIWPGFRWGLARHELYSVSRLVRLSSSPAVRGVREAPKSAEALVAPFDPDAADRRLRGLTQALGPQALPAKLADWLAQVLAVGRIFFLG